MADPAIVLHSPALREDGEDVRLSWRIDNFAEAQELWYSVPAEFGDALAPASADAYVLGVLSGAMESGHDIVVRGSLSEMLFYNLTRYYMPMLSIVRPALRPVRILPDELRIRPRPASPGAGAGISGGIDSFALLAEHYRDAAPPSYRVTHLVMSNVGSHGPRRVSRPRFHLRRARLSQLAAELDLAFIPVDSNLHDLVSGGFQLSHTLRTLSTAHVLQGLLGAYLFGSSYDYPRSQAKPFVDIAVIDAMAVHLLSTEATLCILVGGQHTRVEKTRHVAAFPASYRHLDVCVHPEATGLDDRPNCSRCFKCARTMLTLELLGALDRYEAVFDLAYWRTHRTRQIGKVLGRRLAGRRSQLVLEIIDLAAQQGISLPLEARILGGARGLLESGSQTRIGRRIKRGHQRRKTRSAAATVREEGGEAT